MKSWQDILYGFFVGLILIWMAVEIVTLKNRVAYLELSQANTAFYLVETSSGKHLKLGAIK